MGLGLQNVIRWSSLAGFQAESGTEMDASQPEPLDEEDAEEEAESEAEAGGSEEFGTDVVDVEDEEVPEDIPCL